MCRGRYAPPATLNLGLSAWSCASRKDKVWRLARHNHQERTNVHSYTNPLTLCSFPLGKARMGLSRGNSVGVAISQPRVEVRSASTLGIGTKKDSNSVGVALSRRRYHSRNIGGIAANNTIINNKQGDTKNTKSRGDSCRLRLGVPVGDARRKTGFPPPRPHYPHRHAVHDDSSHDGKKKRPLAVQKVRRWRYKNSSLSTTLPTLPRGGSSLKAPPLPSPRGGSSFLLCLWRLCPLSFLLVKALLAFPLAGS